jgi:hypothetical protein
MRKLSLLAFASLLILWGINLYLKNEVITPLETKTAKEKKGTQAKESNESLLSHEKRRDLDKIGNVINESNVDLDNETKEEIKVAKKVYDGQQNLKEKQAMLEQSFSDHSSTLKDIKRIQNEIVEIKNKQKMELTNTEKWDPKFVYYLMIQENYTYNEVNQIKSLAENGLNPEEINYITELIKEDAFLERINAFKGQSENSRTLASTKKKTKEKDDFIDNPMEGASLESKLIEMNYNQEEKEEMVYGNNQQH